jgi:hypothetical protein
MQKHIVHQVVGLLLGATVLTGCDEQKAIDEGKRFPFGIHYFTLDDGTQCVANYEGGVTCNWKAKP